MRIFRPRLLDFDYSYLCKSQFEKRDQRLENIQEAILYAYISVERRWELRRQS